MGVLLNFQGPPPSLLELLSGLLSPFDTSVYLTGASEPVTYVSGYKLMYLFSITQNNKNSTVNFLHTAYKKTSLTVKSDNSSFWWFLSQKFTNFETRFWSRVTWVLKIPHTYVKALYEYVKPGGRAKLEFVTLKKGHLESLFFGGWKYLAIFSNLVNFADFSKYLTNSGGRKKVYLPEVLQNEF